MATESGNKTTSPGLLNLSATYNSPANTPFTVSQSIQAPSADGVEDRTNYLAGLRKAVLSAQQQINVELTARMDDDKSREADNAATASKKLKSAVDEAKEEDNYGEEVVGEDD